MVKKAVFIVAAIVALVSGVWLQQSHKSDFETLDGQAYRWQDLKGQWVFVNYFAEWCAPCLREVPELNAFSEYAQANTNVRLFAVSFDEVTKAQLSSIRDKYDMRFSLIASSNPVMPNEKPRQLPATFIIDPNGKVFKQLLGEQSFTEMKAITEQLQTL